MSLLESFLKEELKNREIFDDFLDLRTPLNLKMKGTLFEDNYFKVISFTYSQEKRDLVRKLLSIVYNKEFIHELFVRDSRTAFSNLDDYIAIRKKFWKIGYLEVECTGDDFREEGHYSLFELQGCDKSKTAKEILQEDSEYKEGDLYYIPANLEDGKTYYIIVNTDSIIKNDFSYPFHTFVLVFKDSEYLTSLSSSKKDSDYPKVRDMTFLCLNRCLHNLNNDSESQQYIEKSKGEVLRLLNPARIIFKD